jgi:delta14-sterol reductase
MSLDLHHLFVGFALALGFTALLFVLSIVVPGPVREGAVLRDGSRRKYKLNGLAILGVVVVALAAGQLGGVLTLAIVPESILALFVAANVLSFALTLWLYFSGRRREGAAREGLFSDLWYGVELNPELFGVDLKMWAYRPSLIGLLVINASFAVVEWQRDGHLSSAMMLYQAFTAIYVLNYFQFEHGMLHTWDIVQERFGFMLVWGDLAFVPFCYSIVGWYILAREGPLSPLATIALPILFALGLWIFRGANQQKDEFKRDPSVRIWGKPAETLGGRILVSGFWGIGRKLNYTGEILVYWSFTLLSGTQSIVPYLLPLWLLSLLTHRAWRDDRRCREKYGALWEAYCQRARFKMIPFIYSLSRGRYAAPPRPAEPDRGPTPRSDLRLETRP